MRAHNVACTAKDIDCDDPTAGTRAVAASSSSTTASNCTASATTGGSVGWVMYDTENDKALDVVRAHVEWLGCLRDDAESGNVCADVDSCSWAYDSEQRAGGVWVSGDVGACHDCATANDADSDVVLVDPCASETDQREDGHEVFGCVRASSRACVHVPLKEGVSGTRGNRGCGGSPVVICWR